MINKLNYGKVNGDSEELHALKGFKVLAVGQWNNRRRVCVENHADEREQRCC